MTNKVTFVEYMDWSVSMINWEVNKLTSNYKTIIISTLNNEDYYYYMNADWKEIEAKIKDKFIIK